MNKQHIKKRLRNWKVWIAIASLVGFLLTKAGIPEAKSFLDELMPYVFTVGLSLGIWTSHEEADKEEVEK
ncbi:hypothetical protein [Bacillus mobilis]|uniref:hypothetical protein n=1 Tax=Bacillus mobilis TaxID=2026190 RepID=UPI002E24C5EB|nr:hypothetical protein [Bacillus mobilis]MED0957971.1 hypothetical protein [Bacillus mobilis]